MNFFNINTFMDQFESINSLSIHAPIFGNLSLTSIGGIILIDYYTSTAFSELVLNTLYQLTHINYNLQSASSVVINQSISGHDFNYNNQIRAIYYFFNNLCSNDHQLVPKALNTNTNVVLHNYSYNYYLWLQWLSYYRYVYFVLPLLITMLTYLSASLGSTVRFITNNRLLSVLIVFSMLISTTWGPTTGHALALQIVSASVGFFFYVLLGWRYDFVYRNLIDRTRIYRNPDMLNRIDSNEGGLRIGSFLELNPGRLINIAYFLHRSEIGAYFYVFICLGVFWSTNLWLCTLPSTNSGLGIGMAITYLIAYLANTSWLILARQSMHEYISGQGSRQYLNFSQIWISLFRSLSEAIVFGTVSWGAFAIWEFWSDGEIHNLYAFLLGLLVYLPSMYIQIPLEESYNWPLLYGLVYNITFTSLSISTNGLIFWLEDIAGPAGNLILPIIAGILIPLMPMEFYRSYVDFTWLGGDDWLQTLIHRYPRIGYLYILFLAFAYHNYWIEGYIPFMS